MTDRIRETASHRWTPEHWCRAQYAVLTLVFAVAVLLLITRASALLSG